MASPSILWIKFVYFIATIIFLIVLPINGENHKTILQNNIINNEDAPQQLEPYYYLINDTFTLTCDVSGTYRTVTWRLTNGRHLPFEARLFENKMIVDRASRDAAGIYECVIDDGIVPPFSAIILELVAIDAPRITFTPQMPIHISSGDNVDIHCNVEGKQPISVTWRAENNKPLPSSVRVIGNRLSFNHITTFDAGKYFCSASNMYGNTEKAAYVIVFQTNTATELPKLILNPPNEINYEPIHETQYLEPYYYLINDTSTLTCVFSGMYRDVIWRRTDGRNLPYETRFIQNTMIIERTNSDAAGLYECLVYDGFNLPYVASIIELKLLSPPSITFSPQMPIRIENGGRVEITCNAEGEQPIYIMWYHDDNKPFSKALHTNGNTLLFDYITQYDAGKYVCFASNAHGNTTKVAHIVVAETHHIIPTIDPAFTQRPIQAIKNCDGDNRVSCGGEYTSIIFCGAQQCDGVSDCPNGADERNCNECYSDEFVCDVTRCVQNEKRCDGIDDCIDRADEHGCPSVTPSTPQGCEWYEFSCDISRCIANIQRCDGHTDCQDRTDERDCSTPEVPEPTYPTTTSTSTSTPISFHLNTYPDSQSIKERREVVFQCRDEGPLRARIEWRRAGGRSLPPGSIDYNGRLQIPNIKFEDAGEYICVAVGYSTSTPGSTRNVNLVVEREHRGEQ